jgi:hypothetical protein
VNKVNFFLKKNFFLKLRKYFFSSIGFGRDHNELYLYLLQILVNHGEIEIKEVFFLKKNLFIILLN